MTFPEKDIPSRRIFSVNLSAFAGGNLGVVVVALLGVASNNRPGLALFYTGLLFLWWYRDLRKHPYPDSWILGFVVGALVTFLVRYVSSSS